MGHIVQHEAYAGTEKQFIPHPHTYLSQERYHDEIITPVVKKKPIDLSEFKINAIGEYMGYCWECGGESEFYKDKFDLMKGTHCRCNTEPQPHKHGERILWQ